MEHGNLFESSSAPPYRVPSASGTAVRETIQTLDSDARAGGAEPVYSATQLAMAARFICAAARRDGLPIEQTLIRVKEVWRSTPGRPKPRPGGTDAVLDQLVSACIREFYTER